MTSLFKLIGSGDTMTGMTRAVYAFTAIIGIVILVCAIFMIRNYLNARRKSGVQLKSKTAEKKKERRKQGLFNYDVIDGEDETEGLDPTDPRNQKHDRKKKKRDVRQATRVGMKAVKTEPQKLTISNKSTRKASLRKKTDNAAGTANTMNEPVMPVSNTEPVIILDDKNYEPDIDFDNTPEPSQTVPPEPSLMTMITMVSALKACRKHQCSRSSPLSQRDALRHRNMMRTRSTPRIRSRT